MKSFKIHNTGGLNIFLDDFEFMQSIHKEAFRAIMSPFAFHPLVILTGCTRTVNNDEVTISEGWVLFEGEVCRVEEHSYPDPNDSNKERWVDEEITIHTRQYENNVLHDIYTERKAKIAVGNEGYLYDPTINYWQLVKNIVDAENVFNNSIAAMHESVYYTDFSTFLGDCHHLTGTSLPNEYQFRKTGVNHIDLDAVNSVVTAVLSSFSPSVGGASKRITLRANQDPIGSFNFKVMLNSTAAPSGSRIIKAGESDSNKQVSLPVGETIMFVKTQFGWEWI